MWLVYYLDFYTKHQLWLWLRIYKSCQEIVKKGTKQKNKERKKPQKTNKQKQTNKTNEQTNIHVIQFQNPQS